MFQNVLSVSLQEGTAVCVTLQYSAPIYQSLHSVLLESISSSIVSSISVPLQCSAQIYQSL